MLKWRQRALMYKLFALLPWGARLLDIYRQKLGPLRDFNLDQRRGAIKEMIDMLRHVEKNVTGEHIAEVGSGWHPMLPAFFYGLGASQISMTDVVYHIQQEYVEQTLDYLMQHALEMAMLAGVSEEQLRTRLKSLYPHQHPWQTVWRDKGITYHAPFDFTNTGWPEESVDFIFSNSCLGYVPLPVLENIFFESHRLLRKGGMIAHNVTIYDDYTAVDSTITPVNFLFFSEEEWEQIGNSPLHYQNRCRPSYYLDLTLRAGLLVSCFDRQPLRIQPEVVDRSKLDAEFRDLPDEELFCSHLLLVGQKM